MKKVKLLVLNLPKIAILLNCWQKQCFERGLNFVTTSLRLVHTMYPLSLPSKPLKQKATLKSVCSFYLGGLKNGEKN